MIQDDVGFLINTSVPFFPSIIGKGVMSCC